MNPIKAVSEGVCPLPCCFAITINNRDGFPLPSSLWLKSNVFEGVLQMRQTRLPFDLPHQDRNFFAPGIVIRHAVEPVACPPEDAEMQVQFPEHIEDSNDVLPMAGMHEKEPHALHSPVPHVPPDSSQKNEADTTDMLHVLQGNCHHPSAPMSGP